MNLDNGISIIEKLPGTLPLGGIVDNTPIYRTHNIDEDLLEKDNLALQTKRHSNIDLGGKLAFVIDDVLSKQECEKLIQVTEKMGFRPEAPGIQTAPGMRINQTVHWLCEVELLNTIFKRIKPLLPQELDSRPLYDRLSQRINFYRYQHNNVFNPHTDGAWPGYGFNDSGDEIVQWSGVESMLTMLLYLNDQSDGFFGGETQLFGQGRHVDIVPTRGSALFFRHGFGEESVLHKGKIVTGCQNKYVARINILYEL